ncbi:MAG: hypothetical protein ABL892_08450 [Thiobacillaceae bacterium]
MYRYRAVFAVGRAFDKLHHIEHAPPHLLFLGNSRTDNGIDPRTVNRVLRWPANSSFNLGLPGANALIYHGLVERLLQHDVFAKNRVNTVLLGLDESALQEDNSLGYSSFFSDPNTLWQNRRYGEWIGSYFRLWSYSANLRQLHEPEKASRMIEATLHSLDPVGGSAAQNDGYRAGFSAAQNDTQASRQEISAQLQPSLGVLPYLWLTLAALEQKNVRVIIFIPPLRDRPSAFFDPSPSAAPYRRLLEQLKQRGISVLRTSSIPYAPSEFVNAGHLNDRGAQRYSAWMGEQLAALGVK